VVTREYVPDAGDLILLELTSQAGREFARRARAVVLSPRSYNEKTGLAVVCPVTSVVNGYPFEVSLPAGSCNRGAILPDHLKTLRWRQRQAQKVGRIPGSLLTQVRDRIAALLDLS
jgi:mRNA interferase MazF